MRGYVNINGSNKSIKCAYIGVNGKAQYIRPPLGMVKYSGNIDPPLSQSNNYFQSAVSGKVGNYSVFVLTYSNHSTLYDQGKYQTEVYAYDPSLTRLNAPNIASPNLVSYGTSATVGNYVLFSDSYDYSTDNIDPSPLVTGYNSSLTRVSVPNLSIARTDCKATNVGNYALIGGGMNDSRASGGPIFYKTVDAYSSSLTRTTAANLTVGTDYFVATPQIGTYTLFGGYSSPTITGSDKNGYEVDYTANSAVDAYDTSLTKTAASELSGVKNTDVGMSSTTIKEYAFIFGVGGTKVIAYNASLVAVSAPSMTTVRYLEHNAASINNHAIVGGGFAPANKSVYSSTDVYDSSLIRTSSTDLTNAGRAVASSVGNYALFLNGPITNSTLSYTNYNTMDAYYYYDYSDIDTSKKTLELVKGGTVYEYTGSIENIDSPVRNNAVASTNNYVITAGGLGIDANTEIYSFVNAYDKKFVKTSVTKLSSARHRHSGGSIGDYALFANGVNLNNGLLSSVIGYDASLSKISVSSSSYPLADRESGSVGNYLLFGGGYNQNSKTTAVVEAYSSTLTKSTLDSLSIDRYESKAASVGKYVLFAGGERETSSAVTYRKEVDAYDESLTKVTVSQLAYARANVGAVSIGKTYAIFAGGYNGDDSTGSYTYVDAYNSTLTRSSAPKLASASPVAYGFSIGDYGIIYHYQYAETYDSSLTKAACVDNLSFSRIYCSIGVINNTALLIGGQYRNRSDTSSTLASSVSDNISALQISPSSSYNIKQ